MVKIAKHLIFVFLLLSSSGIAKAQFNNTAYLMESFWQGDPKKKKFFEMGLMAGVIAPKCEANYYYLNSNGEMRDKTVYGKAKLNMNVGFSNGMGIRFAEFGEKSSIGMNIAVLFTYTKMTLTDQTMPIETGFAYSEQIELINILVPISLDYKSGAEATTDKYLKSMYTLGVGMCPQFIPYGGKFNPAPFIKAEAGYFLGIAFKIRVMYFIGEQVWYVSPFEQQVTSTKHINGNYPSFKLSTNGNLLASLIFMPYSRTWED